MSSLLCSFLGQLGDRALSRVSPANHRVPTPESVVGNACIMLVVRETVPGSHFLYLTTLPPRRESNVSLET